MVDYRIDVRGKPETDHLRTLPLGLTQEVFSNLASQLSPSFADASFECPSK